MPAMTTESGPVDKIIDDLKSGGYRFVNQSIAYYIGLDRFYFEVPGRGCCICSESELREFIQSRIDSGAVIRVYK